MALIVQKFGGSSVADIERIQNVARRVARTVAAGNQVVVVLSAMGDTTDDLIALARQLTPYPSEREMDMLMSTGEQQRVAIGRALFTRPALILADEPTGNLDSQNTSEVISLLKEASKKYEQTIIMITHSRSIAQTADRILQVSDGELTDLGRCRE